MQMMRKRRGGDADPLLQAPDRQAGVTGTNEYAIDLQAGGIAKRLELSGGVFELHTILLHRLPATVNCISRMFEIWKILFPKSPAPRPTHLAPPHKGKKEMCDAVFVASLTLRD